MPETGKTQRHIIWAVVLLFSVTVVAVVLLAALVDDASQYVTAILAAATPTIAVLAAMRAIEGVKRDTHALTNGLLDRKVRAGVAEVLPDELVDPSYRESAQANVDARAQGPQGP